MAQYSGISLTKHRVEADLEDRIALNLSTYCTGGTIRQGFKKTSDVGGGELSLLDFI